MRISPTALARVTRKALATTTVAAAACGMTVLAAGTATAATVTADSCTTVIGGRVGDEIALDGSAVAELVRQGAEEAQTIILVHDLTIWPGHLARKIADEELTVGGVPDARTSSIGGKAIGSAVRAALDGSAGLGALPSTQDTTLDTIEKKVAGNCGLTVEATNHSSGETARPSNDGKPVAAPGNPGPDTSGTSGTAGTSGSGTPETSGTGNGGFQGTGDARAPRRDYSGIPAAAVPSAGISVPPDLRYPPSNGVPGDLTTPEFGVLGADDGTDGAGSAQGTAGDDRGGADVRNAGDADALATGPNRDEIQLPMLLAVVALAGVTAGLVRTWVLRRIS